MKQCTKCLKYRIEQEFGNNESTMICRPCSSTKREIKQVIKKYRKYALKRFYNMTLEDYDKILLLQFGKCAICGSNNPKSRSGNFHVDHSHETGKIRGLLCSKCNTALGLLNENSDVIKRLLAYLEYNSSKSAEQKTKKSSENLF